MVLDGFRSFHVLVTTHLYNFCHLLHWLANIHLGNYTRRNAPAVERTVPHLLNVNCNETSKSNYLIKNWHSCIK